MRGLFESVSNKVSLSFNSDPDSVAFCVLATDEEYKCDIALQIHFTLIQSFCFDNDINIVRVNDIESLAGIVGTDESEEPKDAHCILVTVSFGTASIACLTYHAIYVEAICRLNSCLARANSLALFFLQSPDVDSWKDPALDKLRLFCEESRGVYDWVPTIVLPER